MIHIRRRQLAVLALLAVAGERGLSRRQLIGCLWPDVAEESAKHALNQLLYGLRRSASERIVIGTDRLSLNADVVDSDVSVLERAIEAGDFEKAAATYRGPFLDGFYLRGASEFERCVVGERDRLSTLYRGTLGRAGGEIAPSSAPVRRDVGPDQQLLEPRSPFASRRTRRRVLAGAVATTLTALMVGFLVWNHSPPTFPGLEEQFRAEHQRLLTERERSTRGRVFVETPVVQSPDSTLNAVAEQLAAELTRVIDDGKIAHVIPRDTVIAIESAAARQDGLNGPMRRLPRANAYINVMTVLSRREDSVRATLTIQRIDTSARVVETSRAFISTVPWATSTRVIPSLVRMAALKLDEMRSCDANNHIAAHSVPWCWHNENEPVVVPGVVHAQRRAATNPAGFVP